MERKAAHDEALRVRSISEQNTPANSPQGIGVTYAARQPLCHLAEDPFARRHGEH